VSFESTWRRETHPADFPADPHFSRLIGDASPDLATQPRQEIHALEGHPVALGGVVAPFGSFSFRRVQ
jgi:hypothetical protein